MKTTFVPTLFIRKQTIDIQFYQLAFGATELRRWCNQDGSIHVAELSIEGAIFHLHEESPDKGNFSPERNRCVTATMGLLVPDADLTMADALAAGAVAISPVKDLCRWLPAGRSRRPLWPSLAY